MATEQYKREWMVQQQIANRGVDDERVLQAMQKVPRHLFVPPDVRDLAYSDCPVGIGHGQTISQPYIVGLITALLDVKANHRVLDVGTGSGYQAAILAELAAEIHSIERYPELAESAKETLESLGYQNVLIHTGDGTCGYPDGAPYDRIVVGASAPAVPEPLLNQLGPDGRLVIPVGSRFSQRLGIWDNTQKGFKHTASTPVIFVPLIGKHGWGN